MTDASELLEAIGHRNLRLHREADGTAANWALSEAALARLARAVDTESVTAETGAGASTILLGGVAREHHCFTLESDEADRIRAEAAGLGVALSSVQFHLGDSAHVVPSTTLPALDVLLLDGAHAFPYPVVEWYYLGRFLSVGGLLGLDDIWMASVRILLDFLVAEPGWKLLAQDGQTAWFERLPLAYSASVYPDGWDRQGINRGAGVNVARLRHYSGLPRRERVLRHPVLTLRVVGRLARAAMSRRLRHR